MELTLPKVAAAFIGITATAGYVAGPALIDPSAVSNMGERAMEGLVFLVSMSVLWYGVTQYIPKKDKQHIEAMQQQAKSYQEVIEAVAKRFSDETSAQREMFAKESQHQRVLFADEMKHQRQLFSDQMKTFYNTRCKALDHSE